MSLVSVLAPFDDTALAALASRGLVRRARKETDKGLVAITEYSLDRAILSTDGQTINIDNKGPASAVCSCPATGVCRHILAAVMRLREADDLDSKDTEENANERVEEVISALDELLALSNQDILKFAGADAAKAFALASNPEQFLVQNQGINITVKMQDSDVLVSFIAGQGLKGALYKGPKTKSRVLIASSAILLRIQNGLAFKETDWLTDQKQKTLSHDFLVSIETVLEEAVTAVLSGSPDLIVDRLFDLSISMRMQSAPRVSAQLRGLSKSAALANSRDMNFSAEAFLKQVSATHALITALKESPTDEVYTGVLKRNYKDQDDMQLYMLGARHWTTIGGARGITAYAFNNKDQNWYSLTNARAAGMDLGFNPKSAYHVSTWFGLSMQQMMGLSLTIRGVRVSQDNSCAMTLADGATFDKKALDMRLLSSSGAIFDDWQMLRNSLPERLGSGLKRAVKPLPLMVTPTAFGEFSFDEFKQCYRWELLDVNNTSISVVFSGDKDELVARLNNQQTRIKALLLEVYFKEESLWFEPVSMLFENKSKLVISNFGLDYMTKESLLEKAKAKLQQLKDQLPKFRAPVTEFHDPLSIIVEKVINKLVRIASTPKQTFKIEDLIKESEEAGLLLLARSLDELKAKPNAKRLLKSFYFASEIQALLSLTHS